MKKEKVPEVQCAAQTLVNIYNLYIWISQALLRKKHKAIYIQVNYKQTIKSQ